MDSATTENKSSIEQLLRRPEIHWDILSDLYIEEPIPDYSREVTEQIVTDIKYAGYLQREESRVAQSKKVGTHQDPSEYGFFLL